MAARRGLGSIDKLGPNRWRARYTDPAGNRRSAGIYATKKEAEQALAATETKIVTGEWQAPTIARTTLGDYLPGWLDAQEHRLAPATMRLYRDHARRYLLASLPGGRGRTINLAAVPLVAINHDLIRDWHQAVWTTAAKNRGRTPNLERQARNLTQAQAARLARRRRTQTIRAWATETGLPVANTGRLSPALVAAWQAAGSPERPEQVDDEAGRTTAKACNKLLRTVLTDAARSGLIAHLPPPVRGASTTNPEEKQPLTAEQLGRVADAMPPRWRAALLVGAYGAMRPGEVRGLQRKDVTILRDPDGEIVGATVAVEPNELRKPKTKKSRRTVYLPVIAAVALAQHLDQYTGPEATAWVFCTATGTPAGKDNLRHYIKAAAQKAIGRTDLTAHVAMRHTGMTLAAQIPGVSVRDLADRAGHTDTKMSMHYIHRAQNADRAIAQALDQLAATAA